MAAPGRVLAPAAAPRARTGLTQALGPDWQLAIPLVLPILCVMLGLIAFPFLSSIWYSLNDIRVGGAGKFVGLANYQSLISGALADRFWNSVQVSVVYTGGALLLKFVIGMTTALILHQHLVARNWWRALVFIPWSIPSVVSAYTWKWMYDDVHGVINLKLMSWGVIHYPILFLADINIALWAVMGAVVWRGFPFWTMTFLAGMQSIPADMYDAAHIDGAGAVKSFFYITLPNLASVIVVTTMLSGIWTANEVQYVYLLTRGGPANATETFPMLALTLGVSNFDLGMGATVPLLMFPVFAVAIWFLTRRMLSSEGGAR
ncbi:MAG TPA: sugar ABC transporter permease [Chloroflexota bacterium]|nr:sugar ABC transporter permease [Chloroflexota bacterium]